MRFEVDTTQVSRTVTKMTDLIQNVADERSRMMGAVESLSGMWVGEAHDAFVAQVGVDNAEMQSLIQDLQGIADKFDQARIAYEDCESKAMETIAAISI
ncbi:MAG: WXG100 family type VII secretion target [Oscillospiraceae bacterium]|nr:WXG100 family type VII secretion target [Oscillospiraceae bacterium]